jgi:hypothetical protein
METVAAILKRATNADQNSFAHLFGRFEASKNLLPIDDTYFLALTAVASGYYLLHFVSCGFFI